MLFACHIKIYFFCFFCYDNQMCLAIFTWFLKTVNRKKLLLCIIVVCIIYTYYSKSVTFFPRRTQKMLGWIFAMLFSKLWCHQEMSKKLNKSIINVLFVWGKSQKMIWWISNFYFTIFKLELQVCKTCRSTFWHAKLE